MKLRPIIVLFACSWACSSTPPPAAPPPPEKPCPVLEPTLTLSASQRVNPTADGQGRPVQVRVYQLSADARLRNATFEDIWQKDKDALQADMLGVEQHTLFPGETKQVQLKPNPQAVFLGLVALFREPQGKDWYMTYELAPPRTTPPCPTSPPNLSVWLDWMQIQDGQGRTDDAAPPAEAPANGPAAGGN
ncbi:MAG: type VI secretion system lipoprotein TssJ [Polyangiaceae bacterium]